MAITLSQRAGLTVANPRRVQAKAQGYKVSSACLHERSKWCWSDNRGSTLGAAAEVAGRSSLMEPETYSSFRWRGKLFKRWHLYW